MMKRVFQEDVGCCADCGGRMELRAVVIRPPATLKVLEGLLRQSADVINAFRFAPEKKIEFCSSAWKMVK